jgi:hydroxylaminobenzene mutase
MEQANRRLKWHGILLFLVGLFTGFAEAHLANVRMGLAAHLEGVMNGTFLLALGAAWPGIRLSSRTQAVAFWTVLYGTYANWGFTLLAAVFGTAALSPITGAGHSGTPWQERFVTIGFMSVGIAIVVACAMILVGFRLGHEAEA